MVIEKFIRRGQQFVTLLTFWWSKRVNFDYDKVFVIMVGLFVGMSLLGMFKSGIDHAGHIGGLLSGMVVGLVLLPPSINWDNEKTT